MKIINIIMAIPLIILTIGALYGLGSLLIASIMTSTLTDILIGIFSFWIVAALVWFVVLGANNDR